MAVQVIFFKPRGIGAVSAPGVGEIRVREAVTIPGSTTATVQDGESVLVYNGETDPVLVAHGSTPDATATASTDATSAGVAVAPASLSVPLIPNTGAKINIKAVA